MKLAAATRSPNGTRVDLKLPRIIVLMLRRHLSPGRGHRGFRTGAEAQFRLPVMTNPSNEKWRWETNLEHASKNLPRRVRDWEDGSFLPVAALRQAAGFPLYSDMETVLKVRQAINKPPVQIPDASLETLKVLASLWSFRHRARAYRAFSGSLAEAEEWLKSLEVGACLSEPTVLLSSEELETALHYGSSLLLRLKSLSGIPIALASEYPQDREIAFPPGACFEVTEIKRRQPAKDLSEMWIVDAQEIDWRFRKPWFERLRQDA